ncbi:MAG: MBL fold metallo-hydrolase [Acidobacteria bacterium]|nr:MBL fold metallo-hydrolase [Acidobacteriota bacterium]
MILEKLVVGPLEVNCYIFGDENGEVVVIDPGAEGERIIAFIEERGYRPRYIINTHCHIDHIRANADVKGKYNIPILVHKEDAPILTSPQDAELEEMIGGKPSPPADRLLSEGDEIKVGSFTLRVIHTPGHTPGGISLLFDDGVFTGDTLFAGGVGRTDLPGGSWDTLVSSIREKLLVLPDSLPIYPGHGPSSTIGEEKRYNPFL